MKKYFILLMILSTCILKANDKDVFNAIDPIYEKINILSCLREIEDTFVSKQLHIETLSTVFANPAFISTIKESQDIFLTHYEKYVHSLQELMSKYPEDSSFFHEYIETLRTSEKMSNLLDSYFLLYVAVGDFKNSHEQKKICDICAEYLLKDQIFSNYDFYDDFEEIIDDFFFSERLGKIRSVCQKSTDPYLIEKIVPLLKNIHTADDFFNAFSALYDDDYLDQFFNEIKSPENTFETELLKSYQTFTSEIENLFDQLDVFFQDQFSSFEFLDFA